MSHQVQLSPAASHCPTAVLDPAGHAAEPPACRSRARTPRPEMRRILSHPGNPIRTAISHTPAKIPRRARDQYGRTVRAVLPRSAGRPDSREEGSGARTPRATGAPHYMPGRPGSDLPARLMTAIDLRATPAGYLPSTSRRPGPPPGAGQPQRPRRAHPSSRIERVVGTHAYALNGMFTRGIGSQPPA
jgi:hypothetical protein